MIAHAAGAHLHAQPAVGIEARGQRALERERDEAGRERRPEALLARGAADLQDDARLEEERHLVRHLSVYLDLEAHLAGLGAVAAGGEPEPSAIVARRVRDRLAEEAERDEPDVLGHQQDRREAPPREAAANLVRADLDAHGRRLPAVVRAHDGHGLSVDRHVLGPDLAAARQVEELGPVRLEAERERAARVADVEREPPRPRARRPARLEHRAERALVLAERPADPRAERLGHVGRREALAGRDAGPARAEGECRDPDEVSGRRAQNSSSFTRQRLASRALFHCR